MSFSLEGTSIPGLHMMKENKFPEHSAYQAVLPASQLNEAQIKSLVEQAIGDSESQSVVTKTE